VAVKRAVLIICVLALIIDLTQDGALGKASFVFPHSSHKPLIDSSHQLGASTIDDALTKAPPATGVRPPHHQPSTYAITMAQNYPKLICSCHFSSSGGLPRKPIPRFSYLPLIS
jgi:hypothetical protein